MSIEKEVFPYMARDGQLHVMNLDGFWADVGQPKDFLIGSSLYLASLNTVAKSLLADPQSYKSSEIAGSVMIHESATIGTGCKIGPSVVIGPNCKIGDGVRLSNCVLMPNSTVKDVFLNNLSLHASRILLLDGILLLEDGVI